MASDITVYWRGVGGDEAPELAVDRALAVFTEVEGACTRFVPDSPLMQLNAAPDRWHAVPPVLMRAILEAHRAYRRTQGRFDPRVLADLVALGYDRSLPFAHGDVRTPLGPTPTGRGRPWRPRFRIGTRPEVHLGGSAIDLGGIGKGLAARWAGEQLIGDVEAFLVDAGGDCVCRGPGPDGDGWRVGVEDPSGSDEPLAVLELSDVSCATSSIRLRHWTAGGRPVHHLVDPATGQPGGAGLAAVTVVAGDPAEAEVWSKSLFLAGGDAIGEEAGRRSLAALWVDLDGAVHESPALDRYVLWRRA